MRLQRSKGEPGRGSPTATIPQLQDRRHLWRLLLQLGKLQSVYISRATVLIDDDNGDVVENNSYRQPNGAWDLTVEWVLIEGIEQAELCTV